MNPSGRQDRMIHTERYTRGSRADMTLSLAALASGEVPWVAWRVDNRTILILADDFDAQLRAGVIPEVPARFAGATLFSLSMFREAIEAAPKVTRPGDGAEEPWAESW